MSSILQPGALKYLKNKTAWIASHRVAVFVFLIYLLLAIAYTYPLITRLSNSISDWGDHLEGVYKLAWYSHIISVNPFDFFNGNEFYPVKNGLLYSDPVVGPASLYIPINILFDSNVLSYNILVLITYALAAFGMYLLVKYYTNDDYSAFVSGVIFAFFPYRLTAHIAVNSFYWIPFIFLFADKAFRYKSRYYAFISGLFFLLQFLSSIYMGFFTAIAISLYIIILKLKYKVNFLQTLELLFLFSALPSIIILLLIKTMAGITPSYTLQDLGAYSINVSQYLNIHNVIFVGFVPVALLILSIIYVKKNVHYSLYFITAIIIFFFLGSGKNIAGMDNIFFTIIYDNIPLYSKLRTISRAYVLLMFSVAVLAGFGMKNILEKIEPLRVPQKHNIKLILTLIISLLIFLEYIPLSIHFYDRDSLPSPYSTKDMPERNIDLYNWVADQKGDFGIIEIPFYQGVYFKNVKYLYFSTFHWKNLVNGYGSFPPKINDKIFSEMSYFPSEESIGFLKKTGVKYIIIHTDYYSESKKDPYTYYWGDWTELKQNIEKTDKIRLIRRFNESYVYEIV